MSSSASLRIKQLRSSSSSSSIILLPLLIIVCSSVLINQSEAQQNGELMISYRHNHREKGQQHSRESLAANSSNDNNNYNQHDQQQQPVKVQYVSVNGLPVLVQFTYVGPPKILPIATADSYPEGSTINLICTVSGGQRKGLVLNWMKDNQELDEQLSSYSNNNNNLDNVSIEKTGVDISILRINNATHLNSGRFSCTAKNPLGEDSTSVNIVINVELKWNKIPADTEIGLNQDLSIECDAIGQPQPQITWTKHPSSSKGGLNETNNNKSIVVSQGKLLKLTKAQHKDSGLYECLARNGVDQDLRRIIQVKVRVVPARFQEKFSVVQAKSGESAKLECNATGDQPLTVNWFKEDIKLSKRGGDNFEIYETTASAGVNSVLVIRTVGRADGLTYKCVGENEYGNDERLIKLMVVEVPSRPMNVKVKDAWSRSASLMWSSPFAGNSPITSYIVQYWRKNNNEAGQSSQNHRRQEFTVSGTQTAALISNLMPALTYEASVIAENQVGRSEPSENIVINTGEDEPAAAPSDVSVEARGPSTVKVAWKAPPSETWNGKLLGFYIGFRPRSASNTIDVHQNMQMTGVSPGAFSYRTIDYVKGQQVFEAFVTNLLRGYEYEFIVKAFNGIGSGPDSHLLAVRTFDGDLPASPSLFAHQTTHSSISLRWTYPSRAQSSANSIKRYILYYQRQGDESWLEIGIPVEERLRSTSSQQDGASGQNSLSISETGTTSYLLTGLDSGFPYKIYVVAVNNFGMGDPSNIVTTKTEQIKGINEGLHSASHSGDFNVFDLNKQFQLFLVVPIVCTVVMVVVIVSAVLYCSRRMQAPPAQHVITSQPNTLQSTGTWGPEGTIQVGQRYVEFDKGGILKTNGSLLTGTQGSDQTSSGHQGSSGHGGHYPLPYGTMPMNSVVITDQKSWDRQSSAPLKPLVTHIYDSPI